VCWSECPSFTIVFYGKALEALLVEALNEQLQACEECRLISFIIEPNQLTI